MAEPVRHISYSPESQALTEPDKYILVTRLKTAMDVVDTAMAEYRRGQRRAFKMSPWNPLRMLVRGDMVRMIYQDLKDGSR